MVLCAERCRIFARVIRPQRPEASSKTVCTRAWKPPSFFFHTMGGREGLVDTAVKTAETGYMARRLMKALEDMALKYDMTVRTSIGDIVQFVYGDDSLSPMMMEGKGEPLDLTHSFSHFCALERNRAQEPAPAAGEQPRPKKPRLQESRQGLVPWELRELTELWVEKLISDQVARAGYRFVTALEGQTGLDCTAFCGKVKGFLFDKAAKLATALEQHGHPRCEVKSDSRPPKDELDFLMDTELTVSRAQLHTFLEQCGTKYCRALVEPGESVGAIAAQSIAEPATQMTLKTFHFAGVSSMNMTLGVPRIKELIGAAKKLATPVLTVELVDPTDLGAARIVRGYLERTVLSDVCAYIKEVYDQSCAYLIVKLRLKTIVDRRLDLTVNDVREALSSLTNLGTTLKPKMRDATVEVMSRDKLAVRLGPSCARSMFFDLQMVKKHLPSVLVKGVKGLGRAVVEPKVDKAPNGQTQYRVVVEGYGLHLVMSCPGVDSSRTVCNDVMGVKVHLGIEAARTVLISEVAACVGAYGIDIDVRHLSLLGDCMTYRGDVLGINRFGIAKMRNSTLMLASFEKTTDHLFDAAAHGRKDQVAGVSDCIIVGSQVQLGTGLFRLLLDHTDGGRAAGFNNSQYSQRVPLFRHLKRRAETTVAELSGDPAKMARPV
mmetsp:Transcript_68256/g.156712  ORF Transcript_68256/g.156712 Transcript_68256/m.156712 type:complete len:661 (-) Transcript_68256:267-2249(-)